MLRFLVLTSVAVLGLVRLTAADVAFKISDSKNAAVSDAVVSLTRLDQAQPPPLDHQTVEIAQENQEFLPYVTAVRIGTSIVFPNHDTVQHHVYSVSKPKTFELPLYVPGKAETVIFDRPGPVVIGCNIHDWMSAHVLVLETPWFAKTDATGAAKIAAVPSGHYRAEVWHPRLGKTETRELSLDDRTVAPLTFSIALKPDRRIRRAPQSKGGGYR